MKINLHSLLFIGLTAARAITAQNSQTATWHGLTLDVSTRADAEASLGQAGKGGEKLVLRPIDVLFRKGVASALESVTFSKVAGMKKASLFFEAGHLVAIVFLKYTIEIVLTFKR